MKKIGIDARLYNQTGVGVYIKNLLFFLEKEISDDWNIYVYFMKRDFENVQFKNLRFIKRVANFNWHGMNEQVGFYNLLMRDNLDLMHFTYFSYPIRYKKPFISTIHDLTPLLFQTGRASTKNKLMYYIKYNLLKKVFKTQIKNSSRIITPTKTVKEQLINYYGSMYEKKIVPIYEGVNKDLASAKNNDNLKKQFPHDFLLYIGNFYPHKNTEKLVEAFSKIPTDHILILVGPTNFFSERLVQWIKKLGQTKRIIFFKNPTFEDLAFFYTHASALINPSFSEGFGLPLVEATYFNCPVIASNIPVFKEILGDSYVSFDPKDTEDIRKKISNFLRKPMNFDYKDIMKNYSFESMTKQTVHQYKKVLSS